MSKRALEESSSSSNKRATSNPWSSSTVIDCISEYLPVNDLLQTSLVNQDFSHVLNSDNIWKRIFNQVYSNRLIDEKDPAFGGETLEIVKSKFSCPFKAHFALKKSFSKLTILSHENLFKKYKNIFIGEADECFYKDGDENFEPTLEMKQLASSWFNGGSEDSTDCENKYAYFFRQDCADYGKLILTRIKNELTNQVFKIVEVQCSNSYGSVHLEDSEQALAYSSEGGFYVSEHESKEGAIDKDFMMWIQRISNSIFGYPEHGLSYLQEFIKVEKYLGPRDENNLLESKYPIPDDDVEDDEEEEE